LKPKEPLPIDAQSAWAPAGNTTPLEPTCTVQKSVPGEEELSADVGQGYWSSPVVIVCGQEYPKYPLAKYWQ
jgi:hypothetical protein